MEDSVTMLEGECPCGTQMPMLRVEGRSDDTFFLADAAGAYQAHPPVPFEVLFLNVSGLAQYQLVHERQNELLIRFVTDSGAHPASVGGRIESRFKDYLASNRLGDGVRLTIEPVDNISREPGGHKLRQVYSKVPRPVLDQLTAK